MRISWLRHVILPMVFLTVLFVLFDKLSWDLWCSDQFYFPHHGGWKYKRSWWAENLIHRDGRYLIVAIGAMCLLTIAASFKFKSRFLRYRRAAMYLALCIGLSTGIVAIGKATINRHCPWDYARYGGDIPYTSFFTPPVAGFPQGHGFPAGHASGALSLVGMYFVFYGHRQRWAKLSLSFALVLGSIYTFGQLVRGAHFISHNIFTLGLCWLISIFLYRVVFKCRVYPDS